jgi:hypothetical protein
MKLAPWEPDLRTIVDRIDGDDIDLQPDFQRQEVWSTSKKKRLIDTILRGWSIPPIHLVVTADNRMEVLDGQQRLTVVATSHSAKLISSLADENLVFVFRQSQGIRVVDGPPPPALLETIGITPVVDTIVLVEDEAAATFSRQLLERIKPSLSRRIEIVIRGGDGNIVSALRQIGNSFKSVAVVGLFDGDLKGRIPEEVSEISTVLPGDRAIELIFRDMIEADPSALKNAIGADSIEAILFGLRGSNHHDWYEGLCRQLGLTKAQLFPTLVQLWLRRDDANMLAAQEMVERIAGLCSVPHKDH